MGKLQQIYDYYKYLLKNLSGASLGIDKSVEPSFTRQSPKKKISFLLYSFIRDLCGYNKFPEIIEDKDFENNKHKNIYHGFEKYDHGANFLCDFNFHQGNWFDNGFYFTDNKEDAESYSISYPEKVTLKAKLCSNNGIIEWQLFRIINKIQDPSYRALLSGEARARYIKLKKEIALLEKVIPQNDLNEFLDILCKDASKIAIILGYDYEIQEGRSCNENCEHIIIYNRRALCVSKEEYNRFCNKSEKYSDYRLDEEEKV